MYQSGEIKAFLNDALRHIQNQSGLGWSQWYSDVLDASDILRAARDAQDAEPVTTAIVIDMDRLEREVLKGSIEDRDVQKLLPFQSALGAGNTYIHLVNKSAYTVETKYHYIREGETLCKRAGYARPTVFADRPTCPGCLAKAKSVIVNHLLDKVNA